MSATDIRNKQLAFFLAIIIGVYETHNTLTFRVFKGGKSHMSTCILTSIIILAAEFELVNSWLNCGSAFSKELQEEDASCSFRSSVWDVQKGGVIQNTRLREMQKMWNIDIEIHATQNWQGVVFSEDIKS